MNTFGFSIFLLGVTLQVEFGYNFALAGLGGDVVIDPVGEHPGIYIRLVLLFIWFRTSLYLCEHG
jgi:hypothetical protein